MYYFLFDVFPKPQSNTTDTFTPSEIAFLYVFRSLWSNLKNLSKCLKSRILTNLSDVVQLLSLYGTIPSDWCLVLCPFAETYPVKTKTCPHFPEWQIHSCKQMQSVTKLTFISQSWPLKPTGTSQHKVFPTYIMQGKFTLLPPATVSTVETVKNAQLLHNSSALTTNLPYTPRELSCRISPSRPGIRSLFYQYHVGHSHHQVWTVRKFRIVHLH